MADLFQIGYGGGPPKAIDYSKALDPLAQKINTRLKETKAKTDALINNMPQGVPIDKVPEQLRGQVTDFLTQNKQAYVDASKVIASGIPSTDQRYIDAISTINQVDAKFKNLSNTLEDIALKRQAALDGRDHSDGAFDWEISDHEDLANGTMYDNMVIQDDGGFNYNSNDGVTKRWADYSNTFQTSGNGNAGFEAMEDKALTDGDKGREFRRNRYENQFDELIKKLGTKGARDFIFADNDFIAQKTGTEVGTEEFENAKKQLVNKGNFDELKIEYKKYGVDELEKIHGLAKSKYTASQASRGRTNMVILDGFGQITEKQAIAKAKKMGVEGDVSYDARGLRKFVNVGGGKTQIYLQDDQGGYETKGELMSTNEALALRGLDGIGVSFDELVENNNASWEDAPGEELKGGDMGERTGMFGVRGIPLYTRPKE
jgi:hypothetical protein